MIFYHNMFKKARGFEKKVKIILKFQKSAVFSLKTDARRYQFFLQVDGDIRISIGIISSLPKSITNESTIFENGNGIYQRNAVVQFEI